MTVTWYRRPQTWVALGVFVLALGVYTATVAPTISFWDCGEFITTSHILGIPHQPGTPLYVLLGRVFDIVFGSPSNDEPALKTASAVNFMSVLFSALAVMMVFLIVVRVARRADPDARWLPLVGGAVGAMFLLFSETFWNNAIEAEVYGISGFLMTFLTWLALNWFEACGERRSDQILYLVVYLLGLGVGIHLGSLLIYPGIFLLVLLARERRLPVVDLLVLSAGLAIFLLSTTMRNNAFLVLLLVAYTAVVLIRSFTGNRFALWASLLFVVGLSVHLVMLLRAPLDPAINQSQPDNFGTLMSVLRREQYPPLNPLERQAPLFWQFKYYYNYFIKQFYFLGDGTSFIARVSTFIGPVFLGLLGAFHGIRRARPVIWLLVIGYLMNADGLTLYLNFTDHEVRERDYFFFAGFMFFSMFIGLGAAALIRYAAGPEGKSAAEVKDGESVEPARIGVLAKAAAILLVLIAAFPLLPGHTKWFQHDRSQNTIAYEYAWNILAGLDKDAILFTNGDNDTFPIWYLQEVEHFRRDVTVVNLSLVNLPWYVKQLRRREPPLPLAYSNDEIDKLRWHIVEDPETGERSIILVRDYVVYDIVQANATSKHPRPVFFAVTIPRENMAAYYPYLQMEGLTYRLKSKPGPENSPVVDSNRMLANLFGIYTYRGLMDGDTEARWSRYRELAGWQADVVTGAEMPLGVNRDLPYEDLLGMIGNSRRDVFRDTNTRHLLGNYPAALVRGGYDFLMQANQLAPEDTAAYGPLVEKSLACFEFAAEFDPTMQPIIDILPILLIETQRSAEAVAYVDQIADGVTADQEEKAVFDVVSALVKVGEADTARSWLQDRIEAQPDRTIHYELLFRVLEHQKDLRGCQELMQRYVARFGQPSQMMNRRYRELSEELENRENQRIEDAIGESGDGP